MYSIDWSKVFARKQRGDPTLVGTESATEGGKAASKRWLPTVSKTVWALGFTSLLTDISSEMVASILPVYFVLHLGLSPIAFGMLDGIHQGAAALVSVGSGVVADRWRRHKEVAALGYGLSAACRLLILIAGNAWGVIAAIVSLDRIGKGIRTAPRDALISQRSPAADLGTAFGVHRAMDAAGAMLGPVLAFVLLAAMPRRFDVLFVASFGVAIIGLAAIVFFVPAVAVGERSISRTPDSLWNGSQLLADGRFCSLVVTGSLLGFATISESFIFLVLQRRFDVGLSAFPLLYVGTSLSTSLFAIPCGRLADRLGRTRVLLAGYGVLAIVYLLLLIPMGGEWITISAAVVLLGLFYAATDGVLTAMAAATLPMERAGSGLAVLSTATNLARFAASVVFGFLWSHTGISQATLVYFVALTAVLVAAYLVLNRPRQHVL